MADQTVAAPYGTWLSAVTAERVAARTVRLGQPMLDGDHVYWLEGRPTEGGRTVVCRAAADGGDEADVLTPPGFNVRSRVHEYGGGACSVRDGVLWFVSDTDRCLYEQRPPAAPRRVTEGGERRLADFAPDPRRRRLVCVCEDHGVRGEPLNSLVVVDLDRGHLATVASGHDFYASPRFDAGGSRLAWLAWSHPNLPWDENELWVADVDEAGAIVNARRAAAGGAALFQPEWGPDGALYFAADYSGWWNLHRLADGHSEALTAERADFGMPQWVLGLAVYGFSDPDAIVAASVCDGIWRLHRLELSTRRLEPIPLPFDDIAGVAVAGGRVALLAGAPHRPLSVVLTDTGGSDIRVLRQCCESIDPQWVSQPRALSFETGGDDRAHAFYYPPCNPRYHGPDDARPPLIVNVHGGPTACAERALSLRTQYWTSRGFAVLDVNYRGSTGYGRRYRRALYGYWGEHDVADCVAAARWAVASGLADPEALLIRGASAGGYTVLCALAFTDTFRAGASCYGVADLETLLRDTHKFESRYGDQLVGPLPDAAALYRERSPLHHAAAIRAPVIFLQGLEDRVVPPSQAETMVAALREGGVPVAYLAFADEGHGFRRASSVKRALEGELAFYARILNFRPADELPSLTVHQP